jgi:hypothetical protein
MFRRLIAIAVLLATGPLGWWVGAQASPTLPPAGTTCTWGGTADMPTGTFIVHPGLTNTASTKPDRFKATGTLAGDAGCSGTLTYVGKLDAGGTCASNTFHGVAKGLPGLRTFLGHGLVSFGPAQIFDKQGNVVASENTSLNTTDNAAHVTDCNTARGFRGGNFHSVIVFTQ